MSIATTIKNHLLNIPGWRTKRKIVVFESDDWGSIRMPDKQAVEKLRQAGIEVDKCAYMINDALESNEDMEALLDLLEAKPKKPVITANFLTANPDFDKIKESGYTQYFNEPLEATLSGYKNHDKVKEYWIKGNEAGTFRPQLHGREHLNISQWMSDLKEGNKETRLAFDLRTFAVSGHIVKQKRRSYLAAFDAGSKDFPVNHTEIIQEAVSQFEALFGYTPLTFIAPNYTWGDEVEKAASLSGIQYMQGTNTQRLPRDPDGKQPVKRNFLGQTNKYGQKYLVRNCTFEPFSNPGKDWVDSCMKEIKTSFTWNKPAIIAMHRVNFAGSVNPGNREHNLKQFSELVDRITKKWPDVEFMSSDQLAKLL